jgi:AAA domain
MKPDFAFARGQASMTWQDLGIEMKFDLLRLERRTGELTAEVTVRGTSNGHSGLLHRARLNLGSGRSRSEFVTHLTRRWAGPAWPDHVEQAAWHVIEASRRGRPAFLLRDAVEPPAVGWALEPILLARDPVILFGDGGDLKSYCALAFGIALQTGVGLTSGLDPARAFRVAYCDWEWQDWPHKRRLRALCGRGELPEILYVPCGAEGPLTHQVERLQRIFQDHGIDFAFFDSAGLACDGPPEEAMSAIAFFQSLARLEVGSLVIAHTSKDSDNAKPFGSAYWHNSARSTFFVKRLRTMAGTAVDLALYQRKANDGARRSEPIGLHFDFALTGLTSISAIDLDGVRRASDDDAGLRDRIASARRLAGMPMTYAQLAAALELPKKEIDSIRITIKRHPEIFQVIEGVGPSRAHVVNLIQRAPEQAPEHSSLTIDPNTSPEQAPERVAAKAGLNGHS